MTLRPGFIVPDWPLPQGVEALVSTRAIAGASHGVFGTCNLGAHVGDNTSSVEHNRAIVSAQIGFSPIWLTQTHSTDILNLDAGTSALLPFDGSFTRTAGRVCAVLTADCLPVLLCDEAGSQVMALHAGWKGLANGIITKGVQAFDGRVLSAYLGPAISQSCFEVGADVLNVFKTAQKTRRFAEPVQEAFIPLASGKYLANLYRLARSELNALGVHAVYGGSYCTFQEDDLFYSYRREGVTGRLASMIWIRP